MGEKYAFCQNSRRWVITMDIRGRYPQTCPYDPLDQCDEQHCGYYCEREPSRYLLDFLKAIHEIYGEKKPTKEER